MRLTPVLIAVATLSVLTACGNDAEQASGSGLAAKGTFAGYKPSSTAVVYDRRLVPAKADGEATVSSSDAGAVARLTVSGLLPERHYGAHAHVKPCGRTGDDAGPHYQHDQDPVQPSVDPKFANPDNELWLDFATDADGAGRATSEVDWAFGERRPASIVIHETHTHTGEGEAGKAGDRLACLTLAPR